METRRRRRATKHAVDLPIAGADFTGPSEQVKDFHMFRRTDQDLATYGLRCWSPPKATSQPGSRLIAFPPVKGGYENLVRYERGSHTPGLLGHLSRHNRRRDPHVCACTQVWVTYFSGSRLIPRNAPYIYRQC